MGDNATGSIARFSGSLAFLVFQWNALLLAECSLRVVATSQKAGKMHTQPRPTAVSRLEPAKTVAWQLLEDEFRRITGWN
jgi:hypothetical protein